MRVALAGKGGVGKTTIAATAARLLAREGVEVVAIDADSNPNLAAALGMRVDDAASSTVLPTNLVSRRLDGAALTRSVEAVLAEHGAQGPDGVRLLRMGTPAHAEEGCLCAAHATVSAVLSDLGAQPGRVTIVDMEASPEHLSRGTARNVDVLVLVTEPYYRSLEATRRLARLAAELPIPWVAVVANKVRSAADEDAVSEFCTRHGLQLLQVVPWDNAVLDADGRATPLVDATDANDVMPALRRLAGRIRPAVAEG